MSDGYIEINQAARY